MADLVGIGWLHLAELLVAQRGHATDQPEVRELLEQDLRRLHGLSGPWDLVAISGNIRIGSVADEYDQATRVLEWLWTLLHQLGSAPSLIMVPGSTDRVRQKRPRTYLRDERAVSREGNAGGQLAETIAELAEFVRFEERLGDHLKLGYSRSGKLPGDRSLVIDRNGLRVGVLGLNDFFIGAAGDESHADRLAAVCGEEVSDWARRVDVVIVVASWIPAFMGVFGRLLENITAPVLCLTGAHGEEEDLAIRSSGAGMHLVIAAPALSSVFGQQVGYSAGRLWATGAVPHVRVWHRYLTGDPGFERFGPPEHATVDRDGAVTLELPSVVESRPAAPSPSEFVERSGGPAASAPGSSSREPVTRSRSPQEAQVRDVAWSPDGKRIAVLSGRSDLVLYRRDRSPSAQVVVESHNAQAVAWSRDGTALATRSRSSVHCWTAEGILRSSVMLPCSAPGALAWTASGQLVLGSDDGLRVWESSDVGLPDGGDASDVLAHVPDIGDQVFALALSTKHDMAAVGTSGGVLLSRPDAMRSTTWSLLRADAVRALAWAPDGALIAAGDVRGVVAVWDIRSPVNPLVRLEFLTDAVRNLSFSRDGKLLVATALNGSFCAWSVGDWETVQMPFTGSLNAVAFSPTEDVVALGALDGLHIVPLAAVLEELDGSPDAPIVRSASAKVVLLGEGNVGKSCLALRLTQDRYEEIGATHGMKFWSVPLERLDPEAEIPDGERREVVFWDMGGQQEYRLLHHAFLHDTLLALMVMEPRRGEVALRELDVWDRQLAPDRSKVKRILIGSKLDNDTVPRDPAMVSRAMADGRFVEYAETCALNGRGITALRKAIARAIDWGAIAVTARSQLFHRIRNHIELRRRARRMVLPFHELEELVSQREGDVEIGAVGAVVEQLARQGRIADARLGDGSRMVILEVEQVERYAGSLILAARDNPRGVPALELASVMAADMSFPRIAPGDRLPRDQEMVIVECVIDLLIKSGICFRNGRLLIFPALFRSHGGGDDPGHPVAVAYDLVGPAESIYSSLVCWLALGQGIGVMRLWEHRAEFARPGGGSCGLRRVVRSERGVQAAQADRFEVYFDDGADAPTRQFFAGVIDDFLRSQGVELVEHLTVGCSCGRAFAEDDVRYRIAAGADDIGCPRCNARVPLIRTGEAALTVSGLGARIRAFRTETGQIRRDAVAETRLTLDEVRRAPPSGPGVHILHLSDLHITADADLASLLQPLCSDLEDRSEGLGQLRPDLVVVSGDLTNRASPEEFDAARRFLVQLLDWCKLTTERCIVVPGNHDQSWEVPAYHWMPKRQLRSVDPVVHVPQGDGFLVRSDPGYAERFRNFSEYLFHPLFQRPYALAPEDQIQGVLYEDLGIQLLAVNSAWQIDEYFPERSAIHPGALARLLGRADEALGEARRAGRLREDVRVVRIGVWHHPVTGNEKIVDDAFVDAIRRAGVRICLHGHVHEDRADLVGYLHPASRLHVIGAGSFGAPARARPESIPRLYNLLEIGADRQLVRVHTRSLRRSGGAWEPWCVWPGNAPGERRPFYEIDLSRLGG
jgi:3',5'-cyclic AMP phosphodiesterase CpdA